MRETLFRGKKTTSGEWVVGNYNRHPLSSEYDTIEDMENFPYLHYGIDPETVGQYTGLNDKNGKRIFEGDIVKARLEGGNYEGFKWPQMRVAFEDGAFCMINHKNGVFNPLYAFNHNVHFEVLGNIHDNPELIAEVEG